MALKSLKVKNRARTSQITMFRSNFLAPFLAPFTLTIPDPFAYLNEKNVEWVPESEWWYRIEFELSSENMEKQIVL